MLTVVIGLIFSLLLFSLLATTVMELISGILALRGKNLENAIKNMLSGSDQSTQLYDSFRSNPLYTQYTKRLSGSERPPSYLSSRAFSAIMMEVLAAKDSERLEDQITKMDNEELKFVMRNMYEESGGNRGAFRHNMENWYDDMMDRASGWYKRNTQKFLLIVGLFIAVLFNADTIAIYDRLARSPETRLQIANMAKDHINTGASLEAGTVNYQSLQSEINQLVSSDIDAMNNPLGLGWHSFVAPAEEERNYFWLEKALGWLLTALAVSLGAPFWFDLLKKIVNVRSSGNVPVSQPTSPGTTSYPTNIPRDIPRTYGEGVGPGEAVG